MCLGQESLPCEESDHSGKNEMGGSTPRGTQPREQMQLAENMKSTNKGFFRATTLAALVIWPTFCFGQVSPDFNQVTANVEGAIRLSWNSTAGEVYQIQYADSLVDTNIDAINWQILYDNYPSQGTTTFWLDTGNYTKVPSILHPKNMPMRFYRIMDVGSDTTSDEPSISISSPTNSVTLSGKQTITVAATTDQATLTTKLFVDGQEMHPPISTTNWTDDSGLINYTLDTYVINTCEWPNGGHTLFATATALSVPGGGPLDSPPVLDGHAASPFVTVTFNNLVTRISFSQPFFDPALGQTQQVSAVFAANANWTLIIRDINSNAVRNVTGSGPTMLFNWDGNGDGGTNLQPGVYYYYISAQTNGQILQSQGDGGGGGGGPPSPSFASGASGSSPESTELLAVPSDGSGQVVPLVLYPPGADTNGLIIFEGSMADFLFQSIPSTGMYSMGTMDSGGWTPDGYGGPASQDAPPAPLRPPAAPRNGSIGTFGIAYQTYTANGTTGFRPSLPFGTYPPLRTFVQMEGRGTANRPSFGRLRNADLEAINFGAALLGGAWTPALSRTEDGLKIADLRGAGTPFNSVDIGFLILHCVYGTSQDDYAQGCKQMYFPVASGTSSEYLRMSEMNFGGDGTNGLKWMAIAACTSLYHPNWSSMQDQHVYPYNNGLHLLLGGDTDNFTDAYLGQDWASFMLGDPTADPPRVPMIIKEAWYAGARQAYKQSHVPYSISPINFSVAGDTACLNDYLQTKTNTILSGTWTIDSPAQVYPQ
jgi:Family of unknown function (DUF6345)